MKKKKITVVLPAYKAAKTVERTYKEIPKKIIDDIILVDDFSNDGTVEASKKLGLKTFVHEKNKGYGANQKTCYTKALENGADIVVMLHPDYQYYAEDIPKLIEPILKGKYDLMLGSRMNWALKGGMPFWKYVGNRVLTFFENLILRQNLSEYHTGLRVYNRRLLEKVDFMNNSDGFLFDTEMIMKAIMLGFRIGEIHTKTRYFKDASSIKFKPAFMYGVGTLAALVKYILFKRI